MADLAKADVDVALTGEDRYFSLGPLTLTLPVVSFGDGEKTYPTGGVPLPADAPGVFGLNKGVKLIPAVFVAGYMVAYDTDNNTLRIYQCRSSAGTFLELTNAAAPPAMEIPLMVLGE